jgi:uncharacterized membrane protein (DUF106 family)
MVFLDEDTLMILVTLLAACAYGTSVRWTRMIPKMFSPALVAKEREIAKLQVETNALSDVSNFAQHSKNTRLLNKLRGDLDAMAKARRAKGWMHNNAPYLFSWVLQLALVLPLAALYGDLELVMVPEFATSFAVTGPARTAGRQIVGQPGPAMLHVPLIGDLRELNVVVWYLIVQFAMWFALRVVSKHRHHAKAA